MTAGVHGGLSLVTEKETDRITLRRLAEAIVNEDPGMDRAAREVVPLIASECTNAYLIFGMLVEGVRKLAAFDANPDDFALRLEWPTRADALDRLRDGLAGNVEGLLDSLTAGLDGRVA